MFVANLINLISLLTFSDRIRSGFLVLQSELRLFLSGLEGQIDVTGWGGLTTNPMIPTYACYE